MKKKKEKTRRRIRLLPITVTMMALLLVIKLNEIYIGSQQLREIYGVREAVASGKKEEKPQESVHGDAKKDGAEKEEGGHGSGDSKPEPEPEPKTFGAAKSTLKEIEALKARESQPAFTKTELDLLHNLSKRREELDVRENDLELKSKVLEATEKRINDKISEMKLLETQMSKVLAQYNEKQDIQIKSLVKIYESMKPDEAAAIFNEMQMPILLEVIAKMSERKVALVLANMNPKRARDVTQELADKRRKSSGIAAPTTTAK